VPQTHNKLGDRSFSAAGAAEESLRPESLRGGAYS